MINNQISVSARTRTQGGLMPRVEIHHVRGYLPPNVAESVKRSVREFSINKFTAPGSQQLTPSDFTFKFHPSDKYDELVKDIVVQIRLRTFVGMHPDALDAIADELAVQIADELGDHVGDNMSIGVELIPIRLGWGIATATPSRLASLAASGPN